MWTITAHCSGDCAAPSQTLWCGYVLYNKYNKTHVGPLVLYVLVSFPQSQSQTPNLQPTTPILHSPG